MKIYITFIITAGLDRRYALSFLHHFSVKINWEKNSLLETPLNKMRQHNVSMPISVRYICISDAYTIHI